MNPWLLQLLVGSLGLALAALLAGLWLRVWKRDPLASYRMAVIVLLVTLCMPLAQWGVKRWDMPAELNFVSQWANRGLDWFGGQVQGAEIPMHPVAEQGGLLEPGASLVHLPIPPRVAMDELGLLQVQAEYTELEIAALKAELEAGERALEAEAPALGAVLDPWYRRSLVGSFGVVELVLATYVLGLLCALMHTGMRLKRTMALLQDARPVTDLDSLDLWKDLMKGSPLAGRARLLESEHVRVPMCFGLGTPAVVLPIGGRGDLDADLFSCVLLHELVHLERRDTWVMLGQEFARSLFWFHPAAWWLCSKIDLLRELSCDLLVVRRTGRRKRYATALVEYAARMRDELRPSQVQATALLPWSSSTHQLSRRIEMLVKLSAGQSGGSRRSMFLAAGSLFGVLWGGQLATAAAMAPAQEQEAELVEIAEILDAIEGVAELQEHEPHRLPHAEPSNEPMHEPKRALLHEPEAQDELLQHLKALGYVEKASDTQLHGKLKGLDRLRALGYVSDQAKGDDTPKLGIKIQDDAEHGGVRIVEVIKGSVAERTGIKSNDLIVSVNGKAVDVKALLAAREGLLQGKLKLKILRGKRSIVFETLATSNEKKHSAHKEAIRLRLKDHEGNVEIHAIPAGEAHSWAISSDGNIEVHGNPTVEDDSFFDISADGNVIIELKDSEGHEKNHDTSSGDEHPLWVISKDRKNYSVAPEGTIRIAPGSSFFHKQGSDQDVKVDVRSSADADGHVIHFGPNEKGIYRFVPGKGSDKAHTLFVDQDGKAHEFHTNSDSNDVFAWSTGKGHGQSGNNVVIDVDGNVLDLQKNESIKLSQARMEKLHKQVQSIHGDKTETKLHFSDDGDGEGNVFIYDSRGKGSNSKAGSAHGHDGSDSKGSNLYTVDVKGDGAHKWSSTGQSQEIAVQQLERALRLNPDNKGLSYALKALNESQHAIGAISGERVHELLKDVDVLKKLNIENHGQIGELLIDSDDNLKTQLLNLQALKGLKLDFLFSPEDMGKLHADVSMWTSEKPQDKDACSECAEAAPQAGRVQLNRTSKSSDMGAELDRMRDLLRKRQAELAQLQAKLEALRQRQN